MPFLPATSWASSLWGSCPPGRMLVEHEWELHWPETSALWPSGISQVPLTVIPERHLWAYSVSHLPLCEWIPGNQIYPWKINPVIENHDLILMHVIISGNMWVDHIDSIITTWSMRMRSAFRFPFLMWSDENWIKSHDSSANMCCVIFAIYYGYLAIKSKCGDEYHKAKAAFVFRISK